MPRVTYVLVPADTSEPVVERQLEWSGAAGAEGDDEAVMCLIEELRKHFAKTELSTAARQAHRKSILAQLGANAANVDLSKLDEAAGMQMVENISLLANRADVGYVGVNMYADDQAQAKELPLNPRASQLAECCGKMIQVRGDAFLGRIYDDEDVFKRLDFTLADVSSNATWVRQAQLQALRREQQGPVRFGSNDGPLPGPPGVQVQELSPADAAREEGNAAFKRGDLPAALHAYTTALREAGEGGSKCSVAAANNRALVLLKLGRHTEAEADCNTVLSAEPHNVKALLRRASAREALGNTGGAASDYAQALEREPGNKEAAAGGERLRQRAGS